MFDKFLIGSNELGFLHNAGADDWLVRLDEFHDPGTLVIMEIGIESQKTPQEVFDMFASPNPTTRFSRTHVPLKLAVFGSGGLVSRSEAKEGPDAVPEGFQEVRLELEGIGSLNRPGICQRGFPGLQAGLSRNLASGLPRETRAQHPSIQMIKRVQAQEEVPDATPLVVPTPKDLLEEIRTGKETRAIIPVPAGKSLSPGDRVTFAEATFDRFGTPTMIVGGDSVSVILTKAQETGNSYQAKRLLAIEWDPEIGS